LIIDITTQLHLCMSLADGEKTDTIIDLIITTL
jgi:hypothetical protein